MGLCRRVGLFEPRLVLVRTTVATKTQAEDVAARALEFGAACVHVSAVRSLYVWKGQRHDETEWLVEARTTRGGEDLVWRAMLQDHPYEVPLVEAWTVRADRRYADWAAQTER